MNRSLSTLRRDDGTKLTGEENGEENSCILLNINAEILSPMQSS